MCIICTIILLKSDCRLQTAGRDSCSIVSVDVSNCSYRLSVLHLRSSHLSLAYQFFNREKTPKNSRKSNRCASVHLNKPTTGHAWSPGTHRKETVTPSRFRDLLMMDSQSHWCFGFSVTMPSSSSSASLESLPTSMSSAFCTTSFSFLQEQCNDVI